MEDLIENAARLRAALDVAKHEPGSSYRGPSSRFRHMSESNAQRIPLSVLLLLGFFATAGLTWAAYNYQSVPGREASDIAAYVLATVSLASLGVVFMQDLHGRRASQRDSALLVDNTTQVKMATHQILDAMAERRLDRHIAQHYLTLVEQGATHMIEAKEFEDYELLALRIASAKSRYMVPDDHLFGEGLGR